MVEGRLLSSAMSLFAGVDILIQLFGVVGIAIGLQAVQAIVLLIEENSYASEDQSSKSKSKE